MAPIKAHKNISSTGGVGNKGCNMEKNSESTSVHITVFVPNRGPNILSAMAIKMKLSAKVDIPIGILNAKKINVAIPLIPPPIKLLGIRNAVHPKAKIESPRQMKKYFLMIFNMLFVDSFVFFMSYNILSILDI
jgi:hypothetical protein